MAHVVCLLQMAHAHCMHDAMHKPAPVIVPQPRSRRRLQASAPTGLRLTFATEPLTADTRTCYNAAASVRIGEPADASALCGAAASDDCHFACTDASVLTAAKADLLRSRVLPAVAEWFGAALRIREPVAGKLVVGAQPCGFGGPVDMPPSLLGGVAGTDVLVLVTARPIPSSALAFAGHCQEDEGRASPSYTPRRPIVGHANVDPASLSRALAASAGADEEAAIDALLKLVIHEVLHVLGFNRDKLAQFPCPSAPAYNRHQRGTYAPLPCADAGSVDPVQTVLGGGGTPTRRRLSTPKAVMMARRHFNCTSGAAAGATPGESVGGVTVAGSPSSCGAGVSPAECIDGVPLEDVDLEGTGSSHWEARVMVGDVMVGVAGGEVGAVSPITLAVFEDSGWYVPDYDVRGPRCFDTPGWCVGADGLPLGREPFVWGRDRGCAFVTARCDGAAWRAPGYFCEASAAPANEGCTAGRHAAGYCNLRAHAADVPAEHRYFGSPRLGGDAIADYCPFTTAYNNWDCRRESPDAAVARAAARHGEQRCASCRCATSSLFNSTSRLAAAYHGCYDHRCLSPSQLQLWVAGGWRDCNAAAGAITLPGWTGSLTCPPASELCAAAADLGWPEVASVSPAFGPVSGGTAITIVGSRLGDGVGGTQTPRVLVCNTPCTAVAWPGGNGAPAGAPAGGAAEPRDRLVATTAGAGLAYGNTSCHVRVLKSGGREAIGYAMFTRVGPPEPSCRIDLSHGGWSAEKLTSLFLCFWPYVLSAGLGISLLRWGHGVSGQLRTLRRAKAFHGVS